MVPKMSDTKLLIVVTCCYKTRKKYNDQIRQAKSHSLTTIPLVDEDDLDDKQSRQMIHTLHERGMGIVTDISSMK